MSNELWFQIPMALFLGLMMWYLIPVAKHWLENGPRGNSKQWLNASMLLAAVVLFVVFLIKIVQS